MKNLKIISLGIAMLITFLSFGQERTITGTVSDETGPLPGANIVVKGTTRTTQTDFDGKFSIKASTGEILIFSFTGYQSYQLEIGKLSKYNIKLQTNTRTLNEVVVSGYKAEKKAKSTTASVSVSAQTIENRPNASYIKALRGQVTGVAISHAKGQPGSSSSIIFRNSNSNSNSKEQPLYILDGLPIKSEEFRKINPNDIEKVEVIKDKEAKTHYGNHGNKGVIVVKTKKDTFQNLSQVEMDQKIKELKVQDSIVNPVNDEDYDSFVENVFESPKTAPLSTFSIDVDNASYTNVRRFINNGQTVPKDAVRVEEMVNFFKYNYPQPTTEHPFSITTEYSDCPWNEKNKLVCIGLQGKNIPTDSLPASNLVFLIDVSGSMSSANKLPLVIQSLKVLVEQLRKEDKISVVVYAGAAGLVLPPTAGSEKQTIIEALERLQSGGSTAGGAGIELAYKTAEENFIIGGNNRVILATDGDFNVGASSDSDMKNLIENKRKSGVFLTCLGYGMGNYKDSKLETLADKGNGNYAYIDNIQEANRFLGKEFKGSMFAIAKDVKIQIEFNPAHVQAYRLIGYENRKLQAEDFKNDAIDAGELGSGHTVTALYEIIPTDVKSTYFIEADALKYTKTETSKTNFTNELATIKFRYKKPDGNKSTEIVQVIENKTNDLKTISSNFKFSSAVAWFGLKLRDSKLVNNTAIKDIKSLAVEGLAYDDQGYKAEFIRLIEAVK